MSQVMTSTARQENPIRVDSPMEMDRHAFQQDTRPSARASTASSSLSPPPELMDPDEAAHQRAASMAKNRVASEDNANTNARMTTEVPLRISTTEQPRPILFDEAQACTCTPTPNIQPKVPRPCNSFILYRTSKQTETISENPGMSNPQISKIIGEKWANEPAEVKAKWKKLAAQEAERHKLQHPGYQYKPKRKGSSNDANTPRQSYYTDGERCAKCNGFRMLPVSSYRNGAGKFDSDSSSVASFDAQKRHFSHIQDDDGQRLERRRSSSPNPKRRRLPDTAGWQGLAPIQVRQTADKRRSQAYSGRLPASAGHDGRYVHIDTPIPHQNNMAPPPPPRASGQPGSAHPSSTQSGYQYADVDASLRLPPLKTAIPPSQSPAQAHGLGGHGLGYTPVASGTTNHSGVDTRTAAEQIMAIPFSRKQSTLARICPRLPRSVLSPRGAIIAVEGSDQRAVEQVSVAVERSLIVCRDAVVTAWAHPPSVDQMSLPPQGDEFDKLAPVVFKDILTWHAMSVEMVNFVTNKWISRSPNGETAQKQSSPSGTPNDSPTAGDPTKIPVALIKNGFSLTLSDRLACATSVNLQNYQPIDHWQWMATLWRGIVGPDLMVYVKACNQEDMDKLKTVEYSASLRVMIVRVPQGKGMSEATERRLNFEIIEWITDIWPKEGNRAD